MGAVSITPALSEVTSAGFHITTRRRSGWNDWRDNVVFPALEPPNLGVRWPGGAFYETGTPLNSVLNRATRKSKISKSAARPAQSKVRGTTTPPARYYKRGRWAPQKRAV